MYEGELTLSSPITKEEWAQIMDYEFDYSDKITFTTPKGKNVEFAKVRRGMWIVHHAHIGVKCSECGGDAPAFPFSAQYHSKFCQNCGAKMLSE